jgi:hypothetical protein
MVYHRDQWVVFSGKMVVLYINKAHASFHPIYLHGRLNFVRAAPYVLPLYLLYISLWDKPSNENLEQNAHARVQIFCNI